MYQVICQCSYLSVYEAVHFHSSMIFAVVELVVDFHGVVSVAYLDCTPLNFELLFAPVIVFVNYLQPMVMQLPIAVSAADEAVAHVAPLFFVRIVFAVWYCYPCWLLNRDVSCYVAVNRANWFVSLLVKSQ